MGNNVNVSAEQKRVIASTLTVGALATAGAALMGGQPDTAPPPQAGTAPVVGCSPTAVAAAGGRPSVIPASTLIGGGLDLLAIRLAGAPGQILANPLHAIGPGGWLIGDAVTAGAHGGLLISNGDAPGCWPQPASA